MLGGFNTNVPYKGSTYHVQTEDGGIKNPLLITHLYHKGAILNTKQYNYANLLVDDNWKENVRELMKEQHKKVIEDLLAGRYTGETRAPKKEEESNLDEMILEYIVAPEEFA